MVAWAAVGLILGVTFISGPLVGSIDVTGHAAGTYCEASGSANVTIRDIPVGKFMLEPVDDGDRNFSVVGPPARVNARNVQGCPVLALELKIPELGFRSVRKSFLSPGGDSDVTLAVVGGQFDPERITNESYRATVELRLAGDETRTLYNQTTEIPVSE